LTVSQIPFEPGAFTAPVVDYEPPPFDVAVGPAACPTPSPAALHRTPRRQLRPVERTASEIAPPPAASEIAPPPAAFTFADAALRRVLEVIDRRRPIAQLRPMLTPPLLDMVFTLARSAGPDKAAVLQRVRLRTAAVDEPCQAGAAEVFATYSRGRRVRAIAGRIELKEGRWCMVALQIG
jgi:Family of unknown function (DUF6459)